ncbi:hypothetical protein CANARDRAFT_28629 [[Candida] arabinofermentans NRRL YB-2248]|uniref:Uncharacterized protein n=1 Tax=[Candida] arabinofermentans NRRL YB-2248 TaxID=983967 RepID=A0A1E4SZG6_9ASCO|nr:hypothetical protein CANARDRAFT_28629 [[Candida] arabinofermentans NRRL YB-2248]
MQLFRVSRQVLLSRFSVTGVSKYTRCCYSTNIKNIKKGKLQDDDDFDFVPLSEQIQPTKIISEDERVISQEEMTEISEQVSTPWFEKLFNNNIDTTTAGEKIQSYFMNLTTMDNISDMPPNFISSLSPRLDQFGDLFLKESISKDAELLKIYQNTKESEEIGFNPAYFSQCLNILRSERDAEIIQARLSLDKSPKGIDLDRYSDFTKQLNFIQDMANVPDELINSEDNPSIHKLIELYEKIPTPRASNMMNQDFESFIKIVGENMNGISIIKLNEIYNDVINSKLLLTSEELNKWLSVILFNAELTDEMYETLKENIKSMEYPMSLEIYNTFLQKTIQNDELFIRILTDMNNESLEPNRSTLSIISNHAVINSDLNLLFNLISLRIDDYPYHLTNDDLQDLLTGLCILNQTNLSNDILNILLIIQELYKSHHNLKMTDDVENQDESNIPLENPYDLYDLVVPDQKLINFYPHLTGEIFEPVIDATDDFNEITEYFNTMKNHNIEPTLDCYRSLFISFYDNKNILKFDQFQDIVMDLIQFNEQYIIYDDLLLDHFKRIVDYYTELGEIDGNDDNMAQATRVLENYIDQQQGDHHELLSDEEFTQVLSSVIILSNLKVK